MPDTKTALQVINVSWDYSEKKTEYYPTLVLFDYSVRERKVINLTDYKFAYQLSEDKYCPGYSDDKGYHPCETKNIIHNYSYERCFLCEEKYGFWAAFLMQREPNEYMKKYLAKKHYIYLAFFEPGVIKVGTSAESRKSIRPIEQDALVYAYIAESDGFNIQKLEHEISTQLKITEAVSSRQKFPHLSRKPEFKNAELMIKSAHRMIVDRFRGDETFKDWLFSEIDIINLTENAEIVFPKDIVHRVKSEDSLFLVGNFIGLRGRFVIFKSGDNLMAIDERKIIGRYIQDYLEEYDYEVEVEIKGEQLGLL